MRITIRFVVISFAFHAVLQTLTSHAATGRFDAAYVLGWASAGTVFSIILVLLLIRGNE